ncbi:hypothetical protein ILYODFUR_022210 [Ilyodon furcidens]|uniref:Uncharacterized protein n=1 Tax=Ilyodon furcidens TaxID=33524 RepID=A0ABV0TCM8_9TELE
MLQKTIYFVSQKAVQEAVQILGMVNSFYNFWTCYLIFFVFQKQICLCFLSNLTTDDLKISYLVYFWSAAVACGYVTPVFNIYQQEAALSYFGLITSYNLSFCKSQMSHTGI